MNDFSPAALAELARTVADQHGTLAEAIADERDAEAALLAQIVESVRPALRALSSRLKASERTFWPDNAAPATEKTYHPERGVLVDGDGPTRDHPRANEGAIVGTDLALLDDGTFAVLDWSGTWSRWQGATSFMQSALTRVSLRDVVENYNAENIAMELRNHLEGQRGGKTPKTIAAAKARAEKLRSVSTLLGK